MSLFVFNNQQKLIKSIPNRDLISVVQDQAINVSDTLFVELPADIWSNLKEPASYLAVQDPYERFSYHMYKVSKHTTNADTTEIEAIQIGYDELKAYGYIKDRRFNNRPVLEAATAIVDGTDWQLGYIDTDLPNVNTNFYYISRLEALSKLIEATGAEVRFRVEIFGNKIIAKRMDLYKKLGTFKGKRFAYGSNLLEIVKEEDTSELYTALVGRGKGEETDTGGFGRRITFADIAWNKASGKPADKPLGQEFIELPEMTAYYGYPDGEPRTGIVEFGDIEEPELLLKATYERLVETSRPQVQFKAKIQTTGDMQLGEEVAIIRSDLGFSYKTRVFRVKRDYLNNMFTEVELGDKLTETLASRIKKIDTTNARREETIIQYIQTAANGKNKIFRGVLEPTEGMMVNDLWYKPVGEGETMLYTWNGEIWELSKVSAGLLGGTLDAENGDVNLINVNVHSLVGNVANFVQTSWNSANASVFINGEGINTVGTDNTRINIRNGMVRVTDNSGDLSGSFGNSYHVYQDDIIRSGVGVHVERQKSFSVSRKTDVNDTTYGRIIFVPANMDSIRLYFPLDMWGNNITNIESVRADIYRIGNNERGRLSTEASHAVLSGWTGVALASGEEEADVAFRVFGSGANASYRDINMAGNEINNVSRIRWAVGTSRVEVINNNLVIGSASEVHLGVYSGESFVSIAAAVSGGFRMYNQLNMNGNDIVNQSDRTLKKNINDTSVKARNLFKHYRFVEYEWSGATKPEGRHLGLIAQDTPFLSEQGTDGTWYINSSKQIMLNSLGIQELDEAVTRIDRFVSQHDLEIHNLKIENEALRQRITQLEGKVT